MRKVWARQSVRQLERLLQSLKLKFKKKAHTETMMINAEMAHNANSSDENA